MTPDLAIATNWLRDHWDDVPRRIVSRGVDDGSAWGAPPLSLAMELWLDQADSTFVTRIAVECKHYWTNGQKDGCRDCNGYGTMPKDIKQFRYPMRSALARLRKRVHAAPGVVHPAEFIYRLAIMDWNVEAACAAVGLPEERGEEQLLSAIRLLQARYDERPNTEPSHRKSDAQLNAEAVAA